MNDKVYNFHIFQLQFEPNPNKKKVSTRARLTKQLIDLKNNPFMQSTCYFD
jgi:hypothetical protein